MKRKKIYLIYIYFIILQKLMLFIFCFSGFYVFLFKHFIINKHKLKRKITYTNNLKLF